MKHPSSAKRLAAILLCMALLASCFSTLVVTAATAQDYHYTFATTAPESTGYYRTDSGSTNNRIHSGDGANTILTAVPEGSRCEGSDQAMLMEYTKNLSSTREQQNYSVFSLPNNTGAAVDGRNNGQTAHLLANETYKVTITYKVESYVSPAKLLLAIGLGNLADGPRNFNNGVDEVATITGTTSGWVSQSAYITPTMKNGPYVVLKMDDDTNRSGTKVLIGKVDIVPEEPVAFFGQPYTYSFNSAAPEATGYYGTDDAATNNRVHPGEGANTQLIPVAEGNRFEGSDQAMVMEYTKNRDNASYTYQNYAVFSLPNNTDEKVDGRNPGQTAHLLPTITYRVNVTYKVEGYASSAKLIFAMGMGNLGIGGTQVPADSKAVAAITGTTADWVTESILFTPASKNGPYIVLKMDDERHRAGTKVLIGKVELIPVDPATLGNVTVTYNSRGGSAVEPQEGNEGDALSGRTTRNGYQFIGWFADAGCTIPVTAVPAASTTLYAGWLSANAQLQDFEKYIGGSVPEVLLSQSYEATDAYLDNYYDTKKNGNNVYYDCSFAELKTALEAGEAHTGTGAMELSYRAAGTPDAPYPAFSLCNPDTGSTWKTAYGEPYRVTFWYKVQELPCEASLVVYNASANLTHQIPGKDDNTGVNTQRAFAAELTATGDWQKAAVVFEGANYAGGAGVYIQLESADIDAHAGMKVLIDDVTVEKFSLDDITAAGDATITTDKAYHGTHAVSLTATAAGDNRFIYDGKAGAMALTPGKTYALSAWAYSPAAFAGKLALTNESDLTALNGREMIALDLHLPAGAWRQVSALFTVPAGDAAIYTAFTALGSGQVYLDDISIIPYKQDISVMQDYEGFAATTYPGTAQADGTLHGNAGGRTVTTEANHTPGGKQALKLTVDAADVDTYARTVLYMDRSDFAGESEKGYMVQFWAMSKEAAELTFALGSTQTLDLQPALTVGLLGDGKSTISLQANTWKKITLLLPSLGTSSYLTLGAYNADGTAAGGKALFIDDLSLRLYSIPTVDRNILSFEAHEVGQELGIPSVGGTVTVSAEQNHTADGYFSADMSVIGGGGATRPQFNLTRGEFGDEEITVEAGKNYRVSFWVYLPEEYAAKATVLRYWLAAVQGDETFADGTAKDAAKIYEASTGGTGNDTTDIKLTAGQWQKITAEVTNCRHSGKLRLGVATEPSGTHLFVDDVEVLEYRIFGEPDPTATVQSFERFNIGDVNYLGTEQSFVLRNTAVISNDYAYTGTQSLRCTTAGFGGIDRNQLVMIDPATDKPYELEKGKFYTLSFWLYGSEEYDQISANFWLLTTDNIDGTITNKDAAEYDMVRKTQSVYTGQWVQLTATFEAKNGKHLVLGITDATGEKTATTEATQYYLDDITLSTPEFVTVKFDTNGSADTVEPIEAVKGAVIPQKPEIDPYLENYEFLGWFLDKECTQPFNLDLEPVPGNITLYAGWQRWVITSPIETPKEYITVYEQEKVWTGKADNFDDSLDAGERPVMGTPDPVEPKPVTPDSPGTTTPEDTLSTWVIVAIVAAAVLVVGGGSLITLFIVKKKKA